MREQLELRLQSLQAEFDLGQKKLADLADQTNKLQTTLLRISGAIQVLEEELAKADTNDGNETKQANQAISADVKN